MQAKFSAFAKILPVLVVAGCGVANTAGNTTGTTATKAVTKPATTTAQAAPAPITGKDVKTADLTLQNAYARLTASPGIVQRGGFSQLYLDVWSTDKKIKSTEARWYSTEGHLTQWITRNRSMNSWWAPFSPLYQNSLIQSRVHVEFEDGTEANGTLQVSIWVQ